MIRGKFWSLRICAVMTALCCVMFFVACGGGGASRSRGSIESDSSGSGGDTPHPGGTLQVGVNGDPETLAPAASLVESALNIISQINETLFWQNEQGELEPLLATGFKVSPDGLTYTVPIRQGVEFSTGKPMTATDVVFSLEQARKSAYYSSLYENITSVNATSPSTVVIKTRQPVAGMKADLAAWVAGIVPDNYGGESEKQFAQHPIGTGPFAFKSWTPGQQVTLVRNPHYWQKGKPYLDGVVFHVAPDDNSRTSQLRGGDLDASVAPPFSQLSGLEAAQFNLGNKPLSRTDNLLLNLNKPLFKNPKVREAIDLAIDREGIVDAALAGTGKPAASFLPHESEFFDSSIEPTPPNAGRAKALLAEAIKEGVNPSFTLESWAGEAFGTIAFQVVQQDLEEVGFNVKIQPLDYSAVLANVEEGEFDAAQMSYYLAVADPTELMAWMVPSVFGPAGGNEKGLSKLSAEAASELNEAKRGELYDQLQEMVAEERNLITLDNQPQVWAVSSSVVGFEQNRLDMIGLKNARFGS